VPDWVRYRAELLTDNSTANNLVRIRKMESWLDLPVPELNAAASKEFDGHSEAELRPYYQLSCALRLKEMGNAARLANCDQISRVLLTSYPALATLAPGVLAGNKTREKMGPICDRLRQIPVVPGMVTPNTIPQLKKVLSDFQDFAINAQADNMGRPDVLYFMGETAASLGSACALSGQNENALAWFERGGQWFDEAGDKKHATNCRTRGATLELKLTGDVDKAKQRILSGVIAKGERSEPLALAAALADLSRLMNSAGDGFEAGHAAEQAAAELVRLGFKDPESIGLDAAFDFWVDQACGMTSGQALFVLVNKVCDICLGIFAGRVAGNTVKDPARAARASELTLSMHAVTAKLNAETTAATSEIESALSAYFPQNKPIAPAPETARQDEQFAQIQQHVSEFDDMLFKLRQECDRRRTSGEPMDNLLGAAEMMEPMAASLQMAIFTAKVKLARSYILMAAGRFQDSFDTAEEGRTTLLAGRPPRISSFADRFERALYMEAQDRKTRALMMLGDFAGGLKLSQETIADIESERYRVNSPYQQSAFLSSAVDFYINAAFGAFKLKDWDALLEAIELVKARSAIRSRLTPEPPDLSISNLTKDFEETSAAMERGGPAGDAKEIAGLSVRRRWLWDLLAISRARTGATEPLPELNVKAVQSSVGEDEAAIAYFWLNPSVLLVVAVDRERFQVERIILKDEDRESIDEFVTAVQSLQGFLDLDQAAAQVGELLLPPAIRDFVSSKNRLIISPHRSLHLFPFQAARWDKGFLIERFAIRYVPNFSSLLLPWRGCPEDRVLSVGANQFAVPGFALPALPNAEEEAREVAQCYAARSLPGEVLLGNDASRARLEALRAGNQLSKYRCIHLATHGSSVFADDARDEPMESKLFLQNAFLDGMELAGLRLEAEVVVLSACNSGQRAIAGRGLKDVPGDDIFGLQSALFQSGARTILGALWPVETRSASLIVTSFHRHYAEGKSVDVALQSAVLENLTHPAIRRKSYFWAPFFLSSLGSMRG
jgi:CHAT domain-containing protein